MLIHLIRFKNNLIEVLFTPRIDYLHALSKFQPYKKGNICKLYNVIEHFLFENSTNGYENIFQPITTR